MRRAPPARVFGQGMYPSSTSAPGVWSPNEMCGFLQQAGNDKRWPPLPDPNRAFTISQLHGNELELSVKWFARGTAQPVGANLHRGPAMGLSADQAKFGKFSTRTRAGGTFPLLVGDPASNPNTIGTGDFTAEIWIYPVSSTGEIIDFRPSANGNYPTLQFHDTSNNVEVMINASVVCFSSGGPLTLNAWHHLAMTRGSSVINIWVDGVSVASAANSTNLLRPTVGIAIGGNDFGFTPSTSDFYWQEFRFSNGLARYTGPFTPPTQRFPDW